MNLKAFSLSIALLSTLMSAWASKPTAFTSLSNDPDIEAILKEHNTLGTVLIAGKDNQEAYLYNAPRAQTPLTPASTFKIPNSIIALEEGIIKDQHEIIKWMAKKGF